MLDRRSLIILLSLALALTACEPKHIVPPGLIHVVFQADWYPQPEIGGFYQAQLEGLYRAEGLDVEILPGGPTVIGSQMVATGAAQFAMGASDAVLVDNAKGIPEVAVAATMQQDPQAIMVHAESPVHTFADLEGHTVAIKPGARYFQYLVSKYKLKNVRETPLTYSVANFLTDPDYIQQCFVTSEPFFAAHNGVAVRTLLIASSDYQPYRVYFTSPQFLAEHPEVVAKFVKASTEGWKDYLANPAATNAEIKRLNPAMRSDLMSYSVQTLKSGHFIDGDGTPDSHTGHMTAARWAKTYQQLLELKVIPRPFDPGIAYTLRFNP